MSEVGFYPDNPIVSIFFYHNQNFKMSVSDTRDMDESGEIIFTNKIHNGNRESSGIVHSSPNRVNSQSDVSASQSLNVCNLANTIQAIVSEQFTNFNHVIKGQFADINCKIDGQLENTQLTLDKVRDDTKRLRDDFTRLENRVHNSNFPDNPPTMDYIGITGVQNRNSFATIHDRNFSNPGLGDVQIEDRQSKPFKSNAKPRVFDGNEDFGDYLSQFEMVSDLNKWDYHTKSLQLASVLAGPAVGILGELTPTQRRDFDTLVKAMNTRFGSVERSELFRAQLKVLRKGKDESLSQLAQSVKKLTRQAYPNADQAMLDVLSLDYFIDALPNADIRLRIRESRPNNITAAETLAIRLETYQLAECSNTHNLPVNAVTSRNSNNSDPILSCLKEIKTSLSQNFGKINQGLNDIKNNWGQRRRGNYGNNRRQDQNGQGSRNNQGQQPQDPTNNRSTPQGGNC